VGRLRRRVAWRLHDPLTQLSDQLVATVPFDPVARRWLRRPLVSAVVLLVAAALTVGALAATGWSGSATGSSRTVA
jgi:hypothetical protein